MSDERPLKVITRRDLLKGAGLAGAAAMAGQAGLPTEADASTPTVQSAATVPARVVFENLTATEGDLLNAVVARLIPADAIGPGAKEAGAARYIDRALGGALSASKPAYPAVSRPSIATRATRAANRSWNCRRPIRISS